METETETTNRAIPELSTDTRVLAACLCQVGVGQTITYAELTEKIGRNVQYNGPGGAFGNLYSARRRVMNEHRIVFECVRGVGLKRMAPEQARAVGDKSITHIRRSSRRACKKMILMTDGHQLDNETQRAINAQLSALGAIEMFSKSSSVKAIEDHANGSAQPLPIGKTLEMFKK